MNINDYIASGIIEQYVLGNVSQQEKQEVECMSHIYPEISAELLQVQQVLEEVAMENAIEVPSRVKENIFKKIKEDLEINKIQRETAKIVNISNKETINSNANYKKYLIAASIIFVISTATIFIALNKTNNQNQLAANKKINDLEKDLANTKNQLQQQSFTNYNYYVLQGNAKAPNKSLTVIWNKQTGNVFINNVSLPVTKSDKQYQLWGLKDGKPIDLGVFDVSTSLQKMKEIKGMQSFAVTLENKGGSPTPHLEELYAIINI